MVDLSKCISVLLIEDDVRDFKLTKANLDRSKVVVELIWVDNGPAALRYLKQEGEYKGAVRPDVILLDLNMPGMRGGELLVEIKKDANIAMIPVVVLTSSDQEADVLGSYQHGASCYIQKPIDIGEFQKVVQSLEDFWFTVVKLPPK